MGTPERSETEQVGHPQRNGLELGEEGRSFLTTEHDSIGLQHNGQCSFNIS